MYSPKRRFRLFRAMGPPALPIGTATDVLAFARTLASTFRGYDLTPTDGGSMTINSLSVGSYEATARRTTTTISSFTAADWFTNTKDTTSSWIVINGDLTINSGQTLIPPTRKLFTVVYVTGNLTLNGSISMTARGANHSGTGDSGGYTAPVNIRVATGTYAGTIDGTGGSTTNPIIPATGASGGGGSMFEGPPNAGGTGTNGQSGGGTGGVLYIYVGTPSSAGSAGTCFSGGTGGGAQYASGNVSTAGGTNGGAGGKGGGSAQTGGGGAGNPGGSGGSGGTGAVGSSGTGGTLIVICEGTFNAVGGTLVSRGSGGGSNGGVDGGGSGGGSVTLMYGTATNLPTVTTTGTAPSAGGSGSYRRYTIA